MGGAKFIDLSVPKRYTKLDVWWPTPNGL